LSCRAVNPPSTESAARTHYRWTATHSDIVIASRAPVGADRPPRVDSGTFPAVAAKLPLDGWTVRGVPTTTNFGGPSSLLHAIEASTSELAHIAPMPRGDGHASPLI
jgi:hypothetical protein